MIAPLAERREKERRVRAFLEEHGLDAVILASPANFAWFTGGDLPWQEDPGDGAAAVLVTRGPFNFRAVRVVRRLRADHPLPFPPAAISSDVPLPEVIPLPTAFRRLHTPLLDPEIERYRALGEDIGVCVTWTALHVRPGLTASGIRGMLAGQMLAFGIAPTRVIAETHSHSPSPAEAAEPTPRLREFLRLSVTGRRCGLHASLTRLLTFADLRPEVERRQALVQQANAAMIGASQPGGTTTAVVARGTGAFESAGFGGAARSAFRYAGGPIGYDTPEAARQDWLVDWLRRWRGERGGNGCSPPPAVPLAERQAVAWRVRLGLAWCEDTYLITSEGPALLTATPDLPATEIEVEGIRSIQPEILVR